jgi:hypothetical protein
MYLYRNILQTLARRPAFRSPLSPSSILSLKKILCGPAHPTAYRMASSAPLPKLPLFEAIAGHRPESTAVIHSESGRRFRYGELLGDVRRTRDRLREAAGKEDLDGERIAFLVENSYDYVGEQRNRARSFTVF